ncbi:hypothetical protein T01_5578 [Trichinella spiralis]|uniref:Uncharacterized protein n=1 Tax=Trichinella spiralis TaxID=6334 RepID=A0A0V0YVW1_TRISP|nr:hypothetical protein T01_5578 [Trichinella spiralis]
MAICIIINSLGSCMVFVRNFEGIHQNVQWKSFRA